MKPSILDESFRYVPAAATSVADTWRRFGWRPTTDEERRARRQPAAEIPVAQIATVKLMDAASRSLALRTLSSAAR